MVLILDDTNETIMQAIQCARMPTDDCNAVGCEACKFAFDKDEFVRHVLAAIQEDSNE